MILISALEKSTNHLKIETVLNLFPDFATIAEIKPNLVQTLELYDAKLARLNAELEKSAGDAENIRKAVKDLNGRYVIVPVMRDCDICQKALMTKLFYVFPCNHAFHFDCLLKKVENKPKVRVLKELGKVEEAVGEECIFCGDFGVRDVDLDLVDDPDFL